VNFADNAQVVGVNFVAVLGVEISDLGIDVELQQERDVSVWGSFPDDDSISISLVACLGCGSGCRLY
jgi:hypothetical protein